MLYILKKIDTNTSYALWYVTESEEALLNNLNISEKEYKELHSIKSENDRRCWLASRHALKRLFKSARYPYRNLVKKNNKYYFRRSWG